MNKIQTLMQKFDFKNLLFAHNTELKLFVPILEIFLEH